MTPLVRDSAPLRPPPGGPLPAAGSASRTLRPLLEGPRRPARVLALFPSALYLELRGASEPRTVAVVTSDAVRLPNAIVLGVPARDRPLRGVRESADAWIGEGRVEAGGLLVRARRWWDPRPALGVVASPGGLRAFADELSAAPPGGLAGHPDPALLGACCADGDLAGAVETAERLVGLGPGLTPSGDDILAGLLAALRLIGGALPGGDRAVWLAGWLGAAVTADVGTRTTPLSATLLHCAARGDAGAEVGAALRAVAGLEPPGPAVRRLLSVGHTSGSDLACGVLLGAHAALALAGNLTAV
ncbi:DUF2877 domain-containing protein [Actinomadura flavalba]|uniref:oxamate carbamoyltransferase subunit AllH family protein n=1 Tax=Actinomadura flavalba TaxID=1120938 RepID=UPI00035EE52D|nr:DUF2877 domain-containing protein [Actinomadura flavalba]